MTVTLLAARAAESQPRPLARLPAAQLDVRSPATRVTGPPGQMRVVADDCPVRAEALTRRRIVDIALQEWAFFGFPLVDQTVIDEGAVPQWPRRTPWLEPEESARVADSIAGYWSATPRGAWILERQNREWTSAEGVGARWRDAWSAAFVSWVMCESGLGRESVFRRSIAHHAYIDQAIKARDSAASPSAFAAFDLGEAPIEPGDLLCSARRSAYRSIAERRRRLGEGVRAHCDIVIQAEPSAERIVAVGGNVRGAVTLKLLPATFHRTAGPREVAVAVAVGQDRRPVFAHLKLRRKSIEEDALGTSVVLTSLSRRGQSMPWPEKLSLAP